MLKTIRENPELVKQNIINKNESADIEPILKLDEQRRQIIQESEKLKNLRNTVTNEIAILKKEKKDAQSQITAMKEVSDKIKSLDEELRIVESKIDELVLYIPNIANSSIPVGKNETNNKFIRSWGEPKIQSTKKDHVEIAKSLGIIDFERGSKVSGSGFFYYIGQGARLERSLINYMLDFHTKKHRYKEILTPFIVNSNSMVGTGQIPKLKEDMYHAEVDDLYLIPTAEVPITNFHSNEMLKAEDLPIKFCGYSPCFRREAGSYGKDTRGMLRVHQFNKVELVKLVKPEDSYNELELLVNDVEDILKDLKLHYRVIQLCTGDTSFSSAMTYDLEVWSPADEKWLEVSSCSNFENFQARRANIRFKPEVNAKPEFIHTLNGSGLATPRVMIAILENYIQDDGRLLVPEPLQPYFCSEYIG